MTSNAVPPSVTPPSPFEWPETVKAITNVTVNNQAQVTCPTHGFTSADQGVTSVMFKQIVGMLPLNGQPGRIQQVIDVDNFTVDVNTTGYPVYRSGGVIIILTGQPPAETVGFQTFNTPFQNIAKTN